MSLGADCIDLAFFRQSVVFDLNFPLLDHRDGRQEKHGPLRRRHQDIGGFDAAAFGSARSTKNLVMTSAIPSQWRTAAYLGQHRVVRGHGQPQAQDHQ
ncbi:hypothetical protein D3C76_377840 [compost metagenome]|jgi:hypothetical protein